MTLRYCIKCQEIVDDPDTFNQEGTIFHNTCRYSLLYFGAEPVKLSPKTLLDEYDVSHNTSPLENFTGRSYIINSSDSLSIAIIECKDMLKHQPDNEQALLHLLKLYRTQQNASEFIETANKVLALDPEHEETNVVLAQHYKAKKELESAQKHIDIVLKNNPTHLLALELHGFIQLESAQTEESYKTFMELQDRLESKEDKERIKSVIRNLQTNLDEETSP